MKVIRTIYAVVKEFYIIFLALICAIGIVIGLIYLGNWYKETHPEPVYDFTLCVGEPLGKDFYVGKDRMVLYQTQGNWVTYKVYVNYTWYYATIKNGIVVTIKKDE